MIYSAHIYLRRYLMKFEDISKELNIPLWKIKNIYFSGINKLKKRIKEDTTLRKELEELLKDININNTNIPVAI